MRWQRLVIYALLVLAWAALAGWQWREYGHEREIARQALRREAESISVALVGMVKSHRRFGPYFDEQLQGTLEELVLAEDIIAVAIASEEGILAGAVEAQGDRGPEGVANAAEDVQHRFLTGAAERGLPDPSPPYRRGPSWDDPTAYRLVTQFTLLPPTETESRGGPWGAGRGGRGRGGRWGRGGPWRNGADEPPGPPLPEQPTVADPGVGEPDSFFAAGGQFWIALYLDRADVDVQQDRAFWLRALVVAAGALVLVCLAVAWNVTMRLVEARGRTRLLETEARHLRELGQAAAGLAHETRNPLGLIRGWTQQLADADARSTHQQQARAIVEECDRVTARINQFLAFARQAQPRLQTVDPGRLVDELAALLEPDLKAKDVQLERTGFEPGATVQADREMLRQALFNLLQNAIEFSPENGAVEVTFRDGGNGYGRIEVADRGPGVPVDAVASLFTPYFTTRADGTGLGLAIVQRIAVAHGWHAGFSPRPGGGAVFYLDRLHG
jgi:signal transduction histidine kinase